MHAAASGDLTLVTGGAGFIGSATVRDLLAAGGRVRVLDDLSTGREGNLTGLPVQLIRGDVRDRAAVRAAVAGVSNVIHLAARPSVSGSCDDPVDFDTVNTHGTVVVLEEARRAGVRRLVFASSSAVYGSSELLPKREDHPIACESPYAASKAAGEHYCSAFSRSLGIEAVALRYFNVFGPRQDPKSLYAAVVPKFVELALAGEPFLIFGDGEQGRDFVAVEDVARANRLASVAPGADGHVINIGGGRMITVNDLGRWIAGAAGRPFEATRLPPRVGDVRMSVADIGLARTLLGWEPRVALDEALTSTVAWYRERVGP